MKRSALPRQSKRLIKCPIHKAYKRELELRYRDYPPYWHAHHTEGRIGKAKLMFVMIPPSLHIQIHENPKWAKENGWLVRPCGTYDVQQDVVVRAKVRQGELIAGLNNQALPQGEN